MADRNERPEWARHSEEQLRAWMRLTPDERLRWLDQAKRFCREALGLAQASAASRPPKR